MIKTRIINENRKGYFFMRKYLIAPLLMMVVFMLGACQHKEKLGIDPEQVLKIEVVCQELNAEEQMVEIKKELRIKEENNGADNIQAFITDLNKITFTTYPDRRFITINKEVVFYIYLENKERIIIYQNLVIVTNAAGTHVEREIECTENNFTTLFTKYQNRFIPIVVAEE